MTKKTDYTYVGKLVTLTGNPLGQIHKHVVYVGQPYIYPLYKIHKLGHEEIDARVTPCSMVTSVVGGTTYRLGIFIESILKHLFQLNFVNLNWLGTRRTF